MIRATHGNLLRSLRRRFFRFCDIPCFLQAEQHQGRGEERPSSCWQFLQRIRLFPSIELTVPKQLKSYHSTCRLFGCCEHTQVFILSLNRYIGTKSFPVLAHSLRTETQLTKWKDRIQR